MFIVWYFTLVEKFTSLGLDSRELDREPTYLGREPTTHAGKIRKRRARYRMGMVRFGDKGLFDRYSKKFWLNLDITFFCFHMPVREKKLTFR